MMPAWGTERQSSRAYGRAWHWGGDGRVPLVVSGLTVAVPAVVIAVVGARLDSPRPPSGVVVG